MSNPEYDDPYLYESYEDDSSHIAPEPPNNNPWALYVLLGIVLVVALLLIAYFFGWFGNRSHTEPLPEPVPQENTSAQIPEPEYNDGEYARVQNGLELQALESFPVQIVASVTGTLQNPCGEISSVEQRRDGNSFHIEITETSPLTECDTQDPKEYRQSVPLEVIGLPKGLYTVYANDVERSFEFYADNKLENTPPEFIEQK